MKKTRLFLLILGLFAPGFVNSIVCQADWEWSSNSKDQNPCEIASTLDAECQGIDPYELVPLGDWGTYDRPTFTNTTNPPKGCECSTVMYSLFMACIACQNATTQSWSFWAFYCDPVYVAQYPGDIPPNTAVPNWAYVNFTAEDYFDPAAARLAGDEPERAASVIASISTAAPSASLLVPGNSTGPVSRSSTGTPDNNGRPQAQKLQKVVSIVGGVLGGLVFLAVVGLGAWIFLRMRKKYREETDKDLLDSSGTGGTLMPERDMRPPKMRLYDPSDPSTFPDRADYEISRPYATPSGKPRYTGDAEL